MKTLAIAALFVAGCASSELEPMCDEAGSPVCEGSYRAGYVTAASCGAPRYVFQDGSSWTAPAAGLACADSAATCSQGGAPRCTTYRVPSDDVALRAQCAAITTTCLDGQRSQSTCPFELTKSGWRLVAADVVTRCVSSD